MLKSMAGRWKALVHLGGLLVFVSGIEVLSDLESASLAEALRHLPLGLYAWIPLIAGVAITVALPTRAVRRSAVVLAVTIVPLMVGLDVIGARLNPEVRPTDLALIAEGVSGVSLRAGGQADSWVLTAVRLSRGELEGFRERPGEGPFSPDHPRMLVAEALLDGALVLVALGVLGIMVAIGRLMRRHVIFRSEEAERVAHVAVGWVVSPLLVVIVSDVAADQRFQAMTGDRSLLFTLVPAVLLLGLGVASVFWPYRDSAEVASPLATRES